MPVQAAPEETSQEGEPPGSVLRSDEIHAEISRRPSALAPVAATTQAGTNATRVAQEQAAVHRAEQDLERTTVRAPYFVR